MGPLPADGLPPSCDSAESASHILSGGAGGGGDSLQVPTDVVAMAVRRVTAHPDFAKSFKHPIKFNGVDYVETRKSEAEQAAEVSELALGKLHVFLERYGGLLADAELRALAASPLAASAEVRFWIDRFLREPVSGPAKQKQSRRRRWHWAKREMQRPSGFFSEDEMKGRDPRLFHQLVGRHLDPGMRLSSPMQGSLSTYLMQRLEQECLGGANGDGQSTGGTCDEGGGNAKRARQNGGTDQEGEECDDTMSPFSDDEDTGAGRSSAGGAVGGSTDAGACVGVDDTAVRRANFLKAMRDRFVNGVEPGFDYAEIDGDSDLDDLTEIGRDAEEKYFDGAGDIDDDDDDDL
eukprot:TRINITY_DN3979_c0_g1_i1.p1 TRINITY_DN3979_c0_g1~~TRINITY_DN3979_c0_g1_i1.p1  ORF type:complete len:349 (-),score=80.38 TRINITY_DN3979_c0_g1_i1:77-1123(-)